MIMRIMLVLEAMTMIVVLHSVSREKMMFDIKTLVIMLTNIIFLEIANTYELSKGFTYITFVPYIVYCMWKFKVSLLKAMKYLVLCVIQVTILQFVWTLVLSYIGFDDKYLWGMWVNLLTLLCSVWLAMISNRRRKSNFLGKKNLFVYLAIAFAAILVFTILFHVKIRNSILVEMFVYAIVALIFMLIFMEWYELYRARCIELEKELKIQVDFGDIYQDVIKRVRIRQHNINNQIAAILGTHYVAKTYEELVKSQEKYCGEIMQSNKFNNLLWLGDNVLAGFLYKKFTEIEKQGYCIIYKASVQDLKVPIHMQYIIEMLGILLDNATEALTQENYGKTIKVNIREEQENYVFEIHNPYRYVSFSEIEEWFAYEKSSKGNERGIGLYRIKEICDEQNCEIRCNNCEKENINWIIFGLIIKKQGNS